MRGRRIRWAKNPKQIARAEMWPKSSCFLGLFFSQLSVIVRIFTPRDKANLLLELIYIPHRWGLLYIPKKFNGAALLRTHSPYQKKKRRIYLSKGKHPIGAARISSISSRTSWIFDELSFTFFALGTNCNKCRSPKNATGKGKQRKKELGYPGEHGMGADCQKREIKWRRYPKTHSETWMLWKRFSIAESSAMFPEYDNFFWRLVYISFFTYILCYENVFLPKNLEICTLFDYLKST